jgi:sulfate-transporting ATPase
VIGPNGAGKTTLFRMIIGQEKPDSGALRVGETVSSRTSTRAATRSTRTRTSGRRSPAARRRSWSASARSARARTCRLQLRGQRPAEEGRHLSGGERNRVHLAKLLRRGGNLLLLDEPTNDLDVDTLRSLEEALLSFAGCAVVISHDRWFLDRIATHILAFEGDSKVVWFEGNYQAYEADLKRRLGKQADEPRKFRYRKLADG